MASMSPRAFRLGQHPLQQRDQAPDVVARCQFRHHAAIGLVHRHLGMHRMAEQAAPGIVERDAGFVAGGFDAEHFHRRHSTG
jgi:hypothetical protein